MKPIPSRHHGSAALALAALLLAASTAGAQDPFADAVVDFTVGTGGGFGGVELAGIVLGPPRGGGAVQQSLDVLSLGNEGTITLRFDEPVICDGDGADFTVFENAFHVNTPEGPVFEEYGIVAVSQDGVSFVDLPYDELVRDPVAAVRRVYRAFGDELAEPAAAAMADHVAHAPKDRFGRHDYSLDDLGLDPAVLAERFAAYIDRYDIPPDPRRA